MTTHRIEYADSRGQPRAGRLDAPEAPARAWALFAHGLASNADGQAATAIAAALMRGGIGVLHVDCGTPGGTGLDAAVSSPVADLLAAAQYLRRERQAPALLLAHGACAGALVTAADGIREARAVALIAAQGEPAPVARLERALLVLHSPQDAVVPLEQAMQWFAAARHPKSFVALDLADHLLSDTEDAAFAGETIASWSRRYLPGNAAPTAPFQATSTAAATAVPEAVSAAASTAAPTAAGTAVATAAPAAAGGQGRVRVEEGHGGGFQQIVSIGPHRLIVDEPIALGGLNAGPGPYDLLLAALGSCTAITMRMVAQRRGLPLEHVAVSLRHEKVHAADCEGCETREGKIDWIDRRIEMRGPLDPTQRAALLAIADKCPVHRTLHAEVHVQTQEVPAGA